MRYPARLTAAAVAVGACVVACMTFVDRPLALWLDRQFRGTALYAACVRGFQVVDGLGLLGVALLVVGGAWRIAGGNVPWPVRRLVDALLAAALMLALTLFLKWAIGRSQVDPVFLRDHVYAFHPFRGGLDFRAFPSATMAVSSAFLFAWGVTRPRDRVAAGSVLSVLALAILVTNGHWLSDIVAGTFLGASFGAAARSRRMRPDCAGLSSTRAPREDA